MNIQAAKSMALLFCSNINNGSWELAKELLSQDFECHWPQTNEYFSRDNYIEMNRTFPGSFQIDILKTYGNFEDWEDAVAVIIEFSFKSKSLEGKDSELLGWIVFQIEEEEFLQIKSIREYRLESFDSPVWRKHLSTASSQFQPPV